MLLQEFTLYADDFCEDSIYHVFLETAEALRWVARGSLCPTPPLQRSDSESRSRNEGDWPTTSWRRQPKGRTSGVTLGSKRNNMTEKEISITFLPDRKYFFELRRPWKLATFSVGMLWLLYGALCYDLCDWDIGISLIMGGVTYVLAPWSVATIYNAIRFRPQAWPLRIVAAIVPAMFAVDWVYWLYHSAVGNQMLRWENFKVSMALYLICGIVWCYRGSLTDLMQEFRAKQ